MQMRLRAIESRLSNCGLLWVLSTLRVGMAAVVGLVSVCGSVRVMEGRRSVLPITHYDDDGAVVRMGHPDLWGLKRESHAARWGLMRGYSGKTTKWVDFVKAGSTQRKREEPCPKEKSTELWVWRQEIYF